MINYNSALLSHEAEHYDELSKRFSDLRVEIGGKSSYYYSDQILPFANKLMFIDKDSYSSPEGVHHADPFLVVDNCNICNDIYKTTEFVINCDLPALRICCIDKHKEDLCISSFSYEEVFLDLKMPSLLINDADLYVIKLIKNHNIKHLRVNSRIRNLLSFI